MLVISNYSSKGLALCVDQSNGILTWIRIPAFAWKIVLSTSFPFSVQVVVKAT